MKTIRARLPAILFLWGFLLGMPFYHIPTFTKGPLICALIGQDNNVLEIFTQPHLWTYRPLLVLMFSALYKLFGFHYEPYRIFASIFSGFFAVFVYLFLLELHPSRKIAFFATLIFTLTTPFLDGLWDLSEGGFYSTCLFYGAFLFFVKLSKCDGNHKLENRYAFLFLLFSLLSLLIKETTRAMAPPILFLYCYFLRANKTQWKLFWIFCALSVLTLLPVLSAPPEPGSRAAITTPLSEIAKISLLINLTQFMFIFHIGAVALLLLFFYKTRHIFKRENIETGAFAKFITYSGLIFCTFYVTQLPLMMSSPSYITYFSAKYLSLTHLSEYYVFTFFVFLVFILIMFFGKNAKLFLCVSIMFVFLSYYAEMTFLPMFRLEPSSRHYLLITPFFVFFISHCILKPDIFWGPYVHKNLEKVTGALMYCILFFAFSWHLLTSAFNLGNEFYAIGKVEFPAWNFVRQNGLKDTVVFSPADGYALPPEYLRVAGTDAPYAFYQLPRWFPSQAEFESHLRHTIDKNHLQKARKIFYYSRYETDGIPQDMLPKGYEPYTKIGYWYHIFAMHGIIASPLEKYLKENAKLVYDKTQTFYYLPEYFGEVLKAFLNNQPVLQRKIYFVGIYTQ